MENILKLIEEIKNSVPIEISKIPEIDLYMDQLITFLDDKLLDYKRFDNEKLITKTMVNNYSKDKLLSPSIKKKYCAEHIISLILIYHLKSVLTINDISNFFNIIEKNKISIENIYSNFVNIQKDVAQSIENTVNMTNEKVEKLSINSIDEKKTILALSLLTQASQLKRLAEKIIDDEK